MDFDPNRRLLLTVLTGMALANVSLASAVGTSTLNQTAHRTLVVYFSRSGNTRVIAGVIARNVKADLFEIEPATPYPEDYFQTVEQAKNERAKNSRPRLKSTLDNLSNYQTVYLGFPIWGTSIPPVVQTFLSTHNLADKSLIPFITHGGYGQGDSHTLLAELAPNANLQPPFVMECDQERRTTNAVNDWLKTLAS